MAYLSGSLTIVNTPAPELAWQFANAWWSVMEDESGSSPSQAQDLPSTSQSLTERPEPSPRRLNLLLAEDNLPDALLVRQAIRAEDLPFEIHAVEDGERAVAFLNRAEQDANAPQPDIILLDLNLPKIEGLDVLRKLRDSVKWKHLPVLVVTSSDSPYDRGEARNLGAAYFRKPITFDEFMKLGGFLRTFLTSQGLI